jgi:hypothetical protein
MRYLLFIVLLVVVLITAGCTGGDQKSAGTPTSAASTPPPTTTMITTVMTTVSTPVPTPVPVTARKITDGYWCRDTSLNIGKDPTNVRECYRFFSDGTFKWGYSPGYPLGKSRSCSAPNVKCEYSLNSKGKYDVQGGYSFTLSGDSLIDPHDPPYFSWSSTGIP